MMHVGAGAAAVPLDASSNGTSRQTKSPVDETLACLCLVKLDASVAPTTHPAHSMRQLAMALALGSTHECSGQRLSVASASEEHEASIRHSLCVNREREETCQR